MKKLFGKAQQPYLKQMDKVTGAKKQYHKKCEKHRILLDRIQTASVDSKFTPEQVCFRFNTSHFEIIIIRLIQLFELYVCRGKPLTPTCKN